MRSAWVDFGLAARVTTIWRWRRNVQQCTSGGQLGGAMSVAEQPVVADAMEAVRQHVQQEAPHELLGAERHGFVARVAFGAVILPAEGDAALIEGDESAV